MENIKIKVTIDGQEQLKSLDELLNINAKSFNDLLKKKEQLEQAFRQAEFGTPEFRKLQGELRRTETQLKNIEETVSDITIADKFNGILRVGQAVAGMFAVANVAAATFGNTLGLTEEETRKAEQSFLKFLVVLQALEGIASVFSKDNKLFSALQSINFQLPKSIAGMLGLTAATEGSTVAMSTFGKVSKSALAILGIGAVIAALGTIAVYWDDIKEFISNATDSSEKYNDTQNKLRNITVQSLEEQKKLYLDSLTTWESIVRVVKNVNKEFFSVNGQVTSLKSGLLVNLELLAKTVDFVTRTKTATSLLAKEIEKANAENVQSLVPDDDVKFKQFIRINELQNEYNKLLEQTSDLEKNIKIDKASGIDTSNRELAVLKKRFEAEKVLLNLLRTQEAPTEEIQKQKKVISDLNDEIIIFYNNQRKQSEESKTRARQEAAAKVRAEKEAQDNIQKLLNENLKKTNELMDQYDKATVEQKIDINKQLYDLDRQYIQLTSDLEKSKALTQIKNQQQLAATLISIDTNTKAKLAELDVNYGYLQRDLRKQLSSEQLNSFLYTNQAYQEHIMKMLDLDAEYVDNNLGNVNTMSNAEFESYKKSLANLRDLNIQKIQLQRDYYLEQNRIAQQNEITQAQGIDTFGDPALEEQKQQTITSITKKYADKRVEIVSEATIKINKIEKDSLQLTEDQIRQRNQKMVSAIGTAATNVAAGIRLVYGAFLESVNKQQEEISNQLALLDEQIQAAEDKRNKAREDSATFLQELADLTRSISDLELEGKRISIEVFKAQQDGNTALVNALKAQQDEIQKKINLERNNKKALDSSREAADLAAKAEEDRITQLQNAREAAAERQLQLQERQIEIQKRQAQIDKATGIINAGISLANLAVTTSKKDPTFGILTIGAVTALAGTLAAVVLPLLNSTGFAEGGYTGDGQGTPDSSGFKVAGVVHEGEYVIPKRMVESPKFRPIVQELEKARTDGYAVGGLVQSISDKSVLDQALIELASRPVIVSVEEFNRVSSNLNVTVKESTF